MTQSPLNNSSADAAEFASSSEAIAEILEIIGRSNRVLLCGHVRPDGDCIGCLAALNYLLKSSGKEARLFFKGAVKDEFLPFLPEGWKECETYPVDFDADLTLCIDTASADRVIEGFEDLARGTVVNIDHHADNTRYGRYNWVDPAYAAVGEMIHPLVDATPEAWTPEIASALYLAVVTDTGGFRFSNTSARSFKIASSLIEKGADPAAIASAVWENRSMESVAIAGAVLSDLHFELDGKLVWGEITRELYGAHGGDLNEPENLTGELRTIRGVEVAVLFRETSEGQARASIRSGGRVNVGVIAAKFGGGGHRAAAGLEVHAPFAEARERILETAVESTREQLDVAQASPPAR